MNITAVEPNDKATPANSTPQDSLHEQQRYPQSLVPDGEPQSEHKLRQPTIDPERPSSEATSPPPVAATVPPSRSYHPLSWHVVALLALPSVLGVLARLGIRSALAWVQGVGCFVMGLAVGKRDRITELCVSFYSFLLLSSHCWALINSYPPLYTAITTGLYRGIAAFC
jgi:hypothetical protein